MFRLSRLIALALKELRVVLLDRRSRMTLLASPLVQMFLFGLATTLDVTNISIGVVNRDNGVVGEKLLATLDGSQNIGRLIYYPNIASLHRGIEHKKVIAGLVMPGDLSAKVARGETGSVGMILDGRRINSAQIVAGYAAQMAAEVGLNQRNEVSPTRPGLTVTNWFNPNLENIWFTMPALIAMIATVVSISVSAQSIAREREDGTIDQMLILPLSRLEILAGKLAPGLLIALFNATLFVVLIPLVFHVPLTGSIWLLALATLAFGLSISGMGLAVSVVTQNQQQAFLAVFLFIVPLVLSSGYVTPYDNMPGWLQTAAQANPIYHMLIICQGIFLKSLPVSIAMPHIWAMVAIAVATLVLAGFIFKTRVD